MAMKPKEVVEIIPPKDIFVGNPDAAVTLMEFGEYESEDCAKANEVVKKLLEEFDGKIRFQFRHFPLTLIHQRSLKASESAVAAAQEGKFWEMHDILFETQRSWTVKKQNDLYFYNFAKNSGLDMVQFEQDFESEETRERIERDKTEGFIVGVEGTPSFFSIQKK